MAPPGMPVQAAGPQGSGTPAQSKPLPMVFANCGNCQLPLKYITTWPLANSSLAPRYDAPPTEPQICFDIVPSRCQSYSIFIAVLKPSSVISGLSPSKNLAPMEIASPAIRWPDRSNAIGIGVLVFCATAFAAFAQSSQVAFAPGSGMPACSNSVVLTIGIVTVSCVGRPK